MLFIFLYSQKSFTLWIFCPMSILLDVRELFVHHLVQLEKKKSDFRVSWSYHWLLKLILSTFLITSIWSDSLQIVFTRKVHSTRMFFSIGITPINNFHWSQFQSFEEVEMLQWQRLLRRMASIPDGVCFGKEIKPLKTKS